MVEAAGFHKVNTRPVRFTEIGQKGVVDVTLEPDVKELHDVPVTLKTVAGEPIVNMPDKEKEPGRKFECRAVDAVSGKPVAGAVIETEVRLDRDETGQSLYRPLEKYTTKTGRNGKFTVVIPEKYFHDSDPLREVDWIVTAAHPDYVTGMGFGDPRPIAQENSAYTDPYAGNSDFRCLRLAPAREIFGQVVDAKGRPLGETQIYKWYDGMQSLDADIVIKTDKEGRFRTKIPARGKLNLEVRSVECARDFQRVPLDRNDLGVLRIPDGVRVTGRVLDAQGRPIRDIQVNAPLHSKPDSQPNFCYFTDKEGRFQTDKLSPADYLFTVGGIKGPEPDNHTVFPNADPPDVYVPLLVAIRANEPIAELTLRPRTTLYAAWRHLSPRRPRRLHQNNKRNRF